MDKEILKNKKAVIFIIPSIIALVLMVLFFATDCSAMVFNNKEYKAYKYAIECVEDELKFPDTATYPSFKDVKVRKSQYGSEIILNSYISGKSFEYAWDISGSGKTENALGMQLNYNFSVTVVKDELGDFWCYKCIVN